MKIIVCGIFYKFQQGNVGFTTSEVSAIWIPLFETSQSFIYKIDCIKSIDCTSL